MSKVKRIAWRVTKIILLILVGYVIGIIHWGERAWVESYAIGFDQGYNTGISDASLPGAVVIGVDSKQPPVQP